MTRCAAPARRLFFTPPLTIPLVLSAVAAAATADGSLGTILTDGEKCFLDVVTYELCCLPQPRDDCWDETWTAEKCCRGMAVPAPPPPVPYDDPGRCFGVGSLTYDTCCLPTPNPECWVGEYTPERCCIAPREGPSSTVSMPMSVSPSQDAGQVVRGNPECWMGSLNFEACCLPVPREQCFRHDRFFTAERCCDENYMSEIKKLSPLQRLRGELLTDVDPYSILDFVNYQPEDHYPDSHLTAEIVRGILQLLSRVGQEVSLWMEVGSFIGGSAITTAAAVKAMNLSIGIVCLEPFTGDVGMWATRKAMREIANHPFADSTLKMDQFGHSRIYETFLANVRSKGHQDIVMPLRLSSISGMRLIRQMQRDARIEVVPQVIYLDSAHEEGETLLEVRTAWSLLPSPGILLGDDWSWEGVRLDVQTFAVQMRLASFSEEELRGLDTAAQRTTQPHPGIALINEHDGTWVMFKRPAAHG